MTNRALAASLRGVVVDVNTQERSVTYNTNYDPGWGAVSIFDWWREEFGIIMLPDGVPVAKKLFYRAVAL